MQIPAELVSLIIDNVIECCSPPEMSATLRACCLVDHVWCAIAQPYIYSRFTRYKQEYRNTPFIQTLLGSKHLQSLTKALWIDENWFIENGPEKDLLFKLLPQLHTLGIWASGCSRLEDLQSLERVVISTARLTALHLQSLDMFPIGLFYDWVALEELQINNTTLAGFSQSTGKPNESYPILHRRPQIRLLRMEFNRSTELRSLAWLKHPDCALDFSSIKTLHLDWQISSKAFYEGDLLKEFTSFCARTVEDILIQPDPGEWVDAGLVQRLTQIRVLRFQCSEDAPEILDVIPWMTAFLSTLPHPEILEDLWIPGLLPKQPEGLEGKNDDKESLEAYRDLASLLASAKFDNIRNLWIVTFEEHLKLSNEGADLEQVFRQLLLGVYEAGRKVCVLDYGRLTVHGSETWFYGLLE
ncbi:hypothetical protein BDN72DRAFT_392737 [Pluteus cervinus]|uniref:Uncharacterized protein n=1 Tax=Pluteus cervinus TaxID=181527 RepID=A0ACD3A946_9AGAR|nr:hypothetical protein BDN72DRAFT_392737 [Pluteus cervinus]